MISFTLAREELSRLFSRRILRLALVVVMIVPLLYGALYLWAFWDPYGKLDNIPVALVNLDKPARFGDKTVSAGSDLAAELLEKNTFDWRVVDARTASRGVANGTYYSSLTIPPGFSAALVTADSAHPVRATLRVTMHESQNMIASQIEGKVFGEIRKAASTSASRGYFENVFLGFSDLRAGLTDAAEGAGALTDGLGDAEDGARRLNEGTGLASRGGMKLESGLRAISAGAGRLAGGTGAMSNGVHSLSKGAAGIAAGAADLSGGLDRLATGAGSLAAGVEQLTAGVDSASSSAARLSAGAAQVDAGVAQTAASLGTAATGAVQVRDGAAGVKSLLDAYVTAHPEAAADPTLARALATADGLVVGSTSLADGLSASETGATRLAAGAHEVAVGASQLSAGAARLAEGGHAVSSGAKSLANGSAEANAGGTRLAAGAGEVREGAYRAASAAGAVASGSAKLSTAVGGARDGAASLSVGLRRLDAGAAGLAGGLEDATEGSRELEDGLTAGIADLPEYDAADRALHADMMSDPVELDTTAVGEVENYGTGFAPYFIPLALWVGALIVYLVVNPLPEQAVKSGAPSPVAALAGLWPGMLLAVGQTVLMYVVLRGPLGLAPIHPLAFFGIVLLTAVVYSAILQWLSVSFGPAGKLLAIVALMLQLTSAAGTFPIETLPRFFRALSPWLPMTYAVAGLREAISGGNINALVHDATILGMFGVAAFAGMCFTAWRARGWDSERLKPMFEL